MKQIDNDIWISYLDSMNGKVTIHKGNDEVEIPLCDLMDIIQKYELVMDELYEYGCDIRRAHLVANQTFDLFEVLGDITNPNG